VSVSVPAELRALVTERADERCEYCGVAQAGQEATFHIDHVAPRSAGGPTDEANLALACVGCSLRKGARQNSMDPATDELVPLFNPRTQAWHDHFRVEGSVISGITSVGRATIEALDMNRPLLVAIREEQALLGRPPPGGSTS
jgi:hypothetical protein